MAHKVLLVALLVSLSVLGTSAAWRRSLDDAVDPAGKKKAGGATQQTIKTDDWQPATGSRKFSYTVQDKINGADQHRNETWKNGTVTGTYAAPGGRNGKWLKYEYIGDKNGFRILSTKEVTPDELNAEDGMAAAKDHSANVDYKSDDSSVHYTVTEDQLKAAKDKLKKEESKQNQQRDIDVY